MYQNMSSTLLQHPQRLFQVESRVELNVNDISLALKILISIKWAATKRLGS